MSTAFSNICEIFPLILKGIIESDKNCSPKLKAIAKIDMIKIFKRHKHETLNAFLYMMFKKYNGISFYDYTNELGMLITRIMELDFIDDVDEILMKDMLDIVSKYLGMNDANDSPQINSDKNIPKTGILYDQSEEIENLRKENETLKNHNSQLQNSKNESAVIIKQLNVELSNSKSESSKKIKQLNDELSNFKSQSMLKIKQLNEELVNSTKENKDKDNQIKALEDKFNEFVKEYKNDTNEKIIKAEDKYVSKTKEFQDFMNLQYKKLEKDHKEKIDKLNKNVEFLTNENVKLNQQVRDLSQRLNYQINDNNDKNKKLQDYKNENKKLSNIHKQLKNSYNKLETNNNELATHYNELKSRYNSIFKDREKLKEENEDLKKQIESLNELAQIPSNDSISIYNTYCTEKRLSELEGKVDEILFSFK